MNIFIVGTAHAGYTLVRLSFAMFLACTAMENLASALLEVMPAASTSTKKFAMRFVGSARHLVRVPFPARVCLALGICAVTA